MLPYQKKVVKFVRWVERNTTKCEKVAFHGLQRVIGKRRAHTIVEGDVLPVLSCSKLPFLLQEGAGT